MEDTVRVTTDRVEFALEVKKVRDYRVLAKFWLWPESLVGYFVEKNVDQLLEFCAWDKTYHIVSSFGGVTVNRYYPGAVHYWLAEGNPDPDYVLDDRADAKWILADLLPEVGKETLPTIVSRLKRGE